MGALSLYDLAKKACIRNVAAIIDIGDATYEQVRPVLIKVQNAEQLHQLETNCPQLVGHTTEIWKTIIRKDLEGYSKEDPPEPVDPASWYKLYRKLRRREQRAIQEQEEQLVNQIKQINDSAAERTSKVVDAKFLPQLRKALGGRVDRKPTPGPASKGGDPSKLRFTSGSRTKMVSGQGVLNKARREAKEMSLFTMRGGNSLARPSHQLASRANTPRAPPKSLVDDHQRQLAARDGDLRPGSIAVPRRTSASRSGQEPDHASASRRPVPSSSTSNSVSTSKTGPEGRSEKRRAGEIGEKEVKMAKVPRIASSKPGPDIRDTPGKAPSPAPRPRREVDIFLSPQRRKKT